MIRKNVHFEQTQIDDIDSFGGTFAEHIRRATDDYIAKKKQSDISASSSKKGGKNG